ncbi:MAG: cysteine-rich small domain-containing protein [Oscillospiraceae bacterium]|nr:cysteine-rich small domain-containing protein [Oscillospiraceae bacterium]MBQ7082031.1 cysteine-rich small domain-containing protein [Oscillospiraceae bacterium]MBR2636675.1 cysteine-rich small domain-containing protein [Oscillospiraceae bacterium]
MKKFNCKYYENRDCEYFPCHPGAGEEFNCLFCYCPLYALGENCGGNFVYLENGIKDCSGCLVPHNPGAYDYIITKFSEISELARKKEK